MTGFQKLQRVSRYLYKWDVFFWRAALTDEQLIPLARWYSDGREFLDDFMDEIEAALEPEVKE